MAIGRKKVVDLREIWPKESADFTPWLSENLDLFGEDLGLDLELVEREHSVGKFSLDILAKEITSDRPVAIENQLEGTDHSHLGQMITYAAGVGKEGIGIWICKQFSEEHKNALSWLNDNSNWDFLGIEVKAFSIDGSKPAPFFDVVVEPNEWTRGIREPEILTPTKKFYKEFWTSLLENFKLRYPGVTSATRVSPLSWLGLPAGKTGLYFSWAFRQGKRFHVEIYISTGNKKRNEGIFDQFLVKKPEIESTFGEPLSWEKMAKDCRIAYYRENISVKNVPEDFDDWAVETMKKFRDTFMPFIRDLS